MLELASEALICCFKSRGERLFEAGANLKEGCLFHSSKFGPEDDSCQLYYFYVSLSLVVVPSMRILLNL